MSVEIVFIEDQRQLARMLERGAHVSLVGYTVNGIEFEVLVENDDFITLDLDEDGLNADCE